MISHPHRALFVEVPKTGSTSVRAVLGSPPKAHLNLWQIRHELETCWARYGGAVNRLAAAAYSLLPERTRRQRGREMFEGYFKFGFVRNPWDRVVSLFERREGVPKPEEMTFGDFVDWIHYASATCEHPVPHRHQLDWFVDPSGNVIADFIGRFERLEDDWTVLAARIGADPELPHLQENPRDRHYTEYYDDRTRDVIAERFRVDIETFEYEFGG